jgi:hypothetical protein
MLTPSISLYQYYATPFQISKLTAQRGDVEDEHLFVDWLYDWPASAYDARNKLAYIS